LLEDLLADCEIGVDRVIIQPAKDGVTMTMSTDLHAEALDLDDLGPGQTRPLVAPAPTRSLLDDV
jgi:hypothetical protein